MAPQKRKAGDGDNGNTNKPLKLTRKNLALLNSLNGDNINKEKDSDYPESESNTDSDTMKNTSTTSSGFQQKAYENGILDPITSHPCQDLSTIQQYCTQRRTSTQPSKHKHQQYCENIAELYNEAGASSFILADIMKRYDESDRQYGRAYSRAITQIPEEDFNKGLSNPRPDVLEGLKTKVLPSHMHSHRLHKEDHSLSLCHFAAEFKRIDGNLNQAVYQAAYDGANLVYARDQALVQARARANALGSAGAAVAAAVDKAAKETAVLTCATDGKSVEAFAHHFQNGEYHQNLVARESLLSYPNRGRELIRNIQDHARSKSYKLAALLGPDLKEEEWKEEEEEEKEEEKKEGVKGWRRFCPF